MSSKPATDPGRPWSIAARLTAWYAAAAVALVAAATGYLYWSLTRHLDLEDDQFLAAKVGAVRRVVEVRPDDWDAITQEVLAGGADRGGRFYVRIVRADGPNVETPGMTAVLPADTFPLAETGGLPSTAERAVSDGQMFRLMADRAAGGQYVIHAAMNTSQDEHLLAGFRRRLAYALAVSLIVAAAGGYRIARHGLRPLAVVTGTARRTRPAHLGERIPAAGLPAEVRELADTFNHMLDRLAEAFDRLRQFSADIAHELRAPVANLRTEAEVALARPRSTEEYRAALGSCLEECARLAGLIDNLLFLARAEDPRAELVTTDVTVGAELAAVRDLFEPAATETRTTLAVDAPRGLVVRADRGLLHRAVGNLVSNALAHTPAGGTVVLFAEPTPGGVRVGVRDTGTGIPAEHLPHVFDRFYRADPARSPGGGRVGLGLAIVRGIAALHGGIVDAESVPGSGTTVWVVLPV